MRIGLCAAGSENRKIPKWMGRNTQPKVQDNINKYNASFLYLLTVDPLGRKSTFFNETKRHYEDVLMGI